MRNEYVEQRNGGYYVAGTRISLDSVVCAFNRGDSPQRVPERYPLLEKLSRVHGAIAFYLDHQTEIDRHLEESERELESKGAMTNERCKDRLLLLCAVMLIGCAPPGTRATKLSRCDRLEIWKAVMISHAFARNVGEVVNHETGRDEYRQIYLEKISPTLKRYGLTQEEAFLVFENEGGWPWDIPCVNHCPSAEKPPQ